MLFFYLFCKKLLNNLADNIFPDSESVKKWQNLKEERLQQRAKVFWMTGLSGSGKSTLANNLAADLWAQGFFVEVLDGDNIRSGLCSDLGFSLAEREENIRRVAEVAKLFVANGIIVIVSFISPTKKIRKLAKEIIGEDSFVEVYINASLDACEKRDVKGLYEKARKGEISDFTGVNSPYEAPNYPKIKILTTRQKVDESSAILLSSVLKCL